MTGQAQPRRRGSYGIDAPYAAAVIAGLVVVYLVMATMMAITAGKVWPFLVVLFMVAILGFYLHATLRGKFLVWAELLDNLNLRGEERILDLGCGRGAVLLLAAQHLTTGSGRRFVAKCRSVRQFPRGDPAQRHRRGRGGSCRFAHGRHDGPAL